MFKFSFLIFNKGMFDPSELPEKASFAANSDFFASFSHEA